MYLKFPSTSAYEPRALYSNTTGMENTATGTEALYSNTNSQLNSAHGHRALYSNTIGTENTATGHQALYSNSFPGLDFISQLHPVTYQLDVNGLSAPLQEDMTRDEEGNIFNASPSPELVQGPNAKAAIRYSGILAQDVEAIATSLGYEF